jgi:hypothetical protein
MVEGPGCMRIMGRLITASRRPAGAELGQTSSTEVPWW